MAATALNSSQIRDGQVSRADLNTSTGGSAVIARAIAGNGIALGSTGADTGTGDVTFSVDTAIVPRKGDANTFTDTQFITGSNNGSRGTDITNSSTGTDATAADRFANASISSLFGVASALNSDTTIADRAFWHSAARIAVHSAVGFKAYTNGVERLDISSSGQWTFGTTNTVSGIVTNIAQNLNGTTVANSALALANFESSTNSCGLHLCKANDTVHSASSYPQNGSTIGSIYFSASNGTDFSRVGLVRIAATEAHSATNRGTQMIFGTNLTGGTTHADRVRIDGTGQLVALFGLSVTGNVVLDKTITAGGTTGAQTINKTSGRVNFAAAAASLVVTNSLVTANSIIICTVGSNDTTMKSVQAVAAAGSFTLYPNATPTAETKVNFLVTN